MSNALGTLSVGVVVQRALELVYTMFPLVSRITTDFSNAELDWNQAVNTRKYAVPTVNDFATGSTDRADTNIAVTLNVHKEVHHSFLVTEYTGTKRNLLDESAMPIAIAIGSHMTAAIAALWTNTNYGGGAAQETVITSANMNYGAYTNMRAVLNGRGVPFELKRFAVVNSTGYKASLDDTTIVAVQNNPNNGTIQNGVLTNVANFDVIEYPGLLTTGTSSGTKTGVFATPDSTIMVSRVQRDPRPLVGSPYPGGYQVVTNPSSGLSVLTNSWINTANNTANFRVSWMYGVAVGNANNLQITKSA